MEAGPITESSDYTPTSTFFTGANGTKSPRKRRTRQTTQGNQNLTTKPCIFCKEIHSPTNCTKVIDHETRISIVKRNNLCFNCLGTHHIRDCKSKSSCRNCSKRHHTCLCNGTSNNDLSDKKTKSNVKPSNQGNRNRDGNTALPAAVALVSNTEEKEDDAAMLHSSKRIVENCSGPRVVR